ncbi:MAG: hypothetical protein KAT25_03145 [Sulfuriflexus sp.]|nr:hypothetical protein [Sulfuriflexus sp.]
MTLPAGLESILPGAPYCGAALRESNLRDIKLVRQIGDSQFGQCRSVAMTLPAGRLP